MSEELREDKLQTIVIDFYELKANKLDESWLGMFGANVKYILKAIFGDWVPDVKIKGAKSDVKAFINAVNKEKNYMQNFKRYGLDDPRTWKSRYKLDSSVRKFEDTTGLTWPFK
mgnify:CR=1 FL=1